MKTQRKQYSAEFKAKVAVAALQGDKTLNELAVQYEVHPNQISQWKQRALEELPGLFADRRERAGQEEEALKAALYQQIGQLKVELDWLKKTVSAEVTYTDAALHLAADDTLYASIALTEKKSGSAQLRRSEGW